jgi:hypothetical protein
MNVYLITAVMRAKFSDEHVVAVALLRVGRNRQASARPGAA